LSVVGDGRRGVGRRAAAEEAEQGGEEDGDGEIE
jgi:hypothetical protein